MDKKTLMIIGGVILIVSGGYIYYQYTLTKAAQAKFQQKMAVYNGTTYFFFNGSKYSLTPAQFAMFGIINNPNQLLLTITSDEFSRFKSGGAFNWVGFPFVKVCVYSDADTSGKLYYAEKGTIRWVTDGAVWSSIIGSPTLNIIAGELNVPLNVLQSLPIGSNINQLSDI